MSLIKHHHRALGQLFGHQVSNLRVQQVMVAVHHDVSVQDLRGGKRSRVKPKAASSVLSAEPDDLRNTIFGICILTHLTAVAVADRWKKTYSVASKIVGTPALSPAKVLQVVQVVDSRRKRHLSANRIKLLHAQIRQRRSTSIKPQVRQTSYLRPTIFSPRRSGTQVDWDHCGAVRGCMRQSDCGTSHQPPYRSAAH